MCDGAASVGCVRLFDHKPTLLEFCCDDDSELGRLESSYGINVVRLTMAWSLHTAEGLRKVLYLVDTLPAVDLWAAMPCTVWCKWQHVNLAALGPTFAATLARRRRLARFLIRNYCVVARAVRAKGGRVAMEWPRFCDGWKERALIRLAAELGFYSALSDGCQFGVMSSSGLPLKKPWRFDTTDRSLRKVLNQKRCPGNHKHGVCRGDDATQSGHYTYQLASTILACWYSRIFTMVYEEVGVDEDKDDEEEKNETAGEDLCALL